MISYKSGFGWFPAGFYEARARHNEFCQERVCLYYSNQKRWFRAADTRGPSNTPAASIRTVVNQEDYQHR